LFIPDPDRDFLPIPDPRGLKGTGSRIQGSKSYRIPDPDPQHCLLQGKPLDRTVDVDASVWEEADITPTTLEEEEEFRDETDVELTQTLEEVSQTLPDVQMIAEPVIFRELKSLNCDPY
jgi:hypothetical protein